MWRRRGVEVRRSGVARTRRHLARTDEGALIAQVAPPLETQTATHRTISAVYRLEAPKLIAGLARIVRDVGLAEELAQDALVAALEQWPASGVPDSPGRG